MSFGSIEDALVALTQSVLRNDAGDPLVFVDVLPGDLRDAQTLRELVHQAPAVYWAFLGGAENGDDNPLGINAVFGCYVVTAHAGESRDRRRGDGRQIGAYDILSLVLPQVHGHLVPDIGSVRLRRVENLFSLDVDDLRAALYAATFEVPITFDAPIPALNAFAVYSAEHTLVGATETSATDEVHLEQ